MSKKWNSTFRGAEPSWANACVGDNGQPDYFDYAQGFSSAANVLIKAVLEARGGENSPDTFIYPICFNMRHSVELRLKGVIEALRDFPGRKTELKSIELTKIHDVGVLWERIKEATLIIDSRFGLFVECLDEYVLDIGEVDPSGQTFRYPHDRVNNKHLVDVSVINVYVLYCRFKALEEKLDCLDRFCDELIREYSLGTFTTKLSRAQLFEIAADIPPKSEWGNTVFTEFSKKVKDSYSLTNNDFSRAVCKIQSHYGMASSLQSPPLKFIDREGLVLFFNAWCQINDVDYLKNKSKVRELDFDGQVSMRDIFESIVSQRKKEGELWPHLNGALNVEKLADLKALYECSMERYSEEYVRHFENFSRELNFESDSDKGRFRYLLFKLLGRPQAVERILKGLFLIGHGDHAEFLIAQFELEGCFGWVDEVRAGTFFIEPCRDISNSFSRLASASQRSN
ncbi:hypothetical protein ABH911_003476 [Pseudomonas protegens]|uniref:hypothetical protein n=1 Tax=Pseudomonas protegens TaxID=380021 RepID=UPI003515ECCD